MIVQSSPLKFLSNILYTSKKLCKKYFYTLKKGYRKLTRYRQVSFNTLSFHFNTIIFGKGK